MYFFTVFYSLNKLEYFSLICYCTKRAVYKTHSTGNALILINNGSTKVIRLYSIDTAGCSTRSVKKYYSIVWTVILTSATSYTFFFVNYSRVLPHRYGVDRTDLDTWVSKTFSTVVCNSICLGRTGLTCKRHYLYQLILDYSFRFDYLFASVGQS